MSTTKTQAVVDSVVEQQYDGDPSVVTGWDDIQGSLENSAKRTAVVSYENTYGLGAILYGSLAWQVGSKATITLQTPHAMKLNTPLELHMHYTLSTDHAGKSVRFKINVIAAGVGEAFTNRGSEIDIEVALGVDQDSAGSDAFTHYLINLAEIIASNTTVSSIYKIHIERVAVDSGSTEATQYFIMEYVDGHIQKDQERGSREEYVK